MELRQLQLTSHVSSTLDVYHKIKVNKLSPQDRSLVINVQLSLCVQTVQIGRCASNILWEALLVRNRLQKFEKTEKKNGTKGYNSKNVPMYVSVHLYTDICKI